ncbi:MAG: DHA2 family efflux MFS transporter permease subunit [Ilumatobacter sp.]|uniref:DHA2 family efflux MFS transporter permease subunit n=1 Tax=Ilumatobacter sp. TaxID=1967498 RepID=UPI003C72A764
MSNTELSARQKRNILISMCAALIAVIASVSGLNVAQQQVAVDLGASQGQVLWVINAYTLALAALLMPIGAIGDRWGRKHVLLAGLVVFSSASLLAALAPTVGVLIFARALAGLGAAMVMPVTLSVITSSFPPEERSQAIGIWAGFAGAGGIIGLFTSSFFVDYFSWRWLFVVPIGIMIFAGAMAIKSVPNSSEAGEGRFDVIGSLLSAVAIGGVVFGIHEGPEKGWGHSLTIVGLVAGVAALVGFIMWELRADDPLLDVTAFKNRGLASGSFTITTMFAVLFGIFLVLFPFFQTILGYSALRSAAGLLPMAATMVVMSSLAPKVSARIGSRNTMMMGIVVAVVGLVTLALSASPDGGYLGVLPGLVLIGLGMGNTMTPATEAITATLPAEKQGVASALNDTSRELGGAVGVALLGSIVSSGYADNIAGFAAGLPGELGAVVGEDYYAALGAASNVGQTDPQLAGQVVAAAQQAWVDGWISSMWIGVAMASIAFVYLLVAGPKRTDAVDAGVSRESVSV